MARFHYGVPVMKEIATIDIRALESAMVRHKIPDLHGVIKYSQVKLLPSWYIWCVRVPEEDEEPVRFRMTAPITTVIWQNGYVLLS